MGGPQNYRNGLGRDVFTTGQVARLCGVAQQTVSVWFDAGRLKGYRVPGSKDRRVPRADLLAFLRENGMPVPRQVEDPLVVLAGCDRLTVEGVLLALDGAARVQLAGTVFEAGLLVGEQRPRLLVLDLSLGRSECLEVGRLLALWPAEDRPVLLGLACEDETRPLELAGAGFTEVLLHGAGPAAVAERVLTLAGAE